MRIVLDTSAISAAMHRLPEVMDRLARLDPTDLVISAPAAAEIRFGLERLPPGTRRRALLTQGFELLRQATRWADWSEPAAGEFGRIKAELERTGRRIDDLDVVIASIALDLGASVATFNARHFCRIDGLTVQDWSEPVDED